MDPNRTLAHVIIKMTPRVLDTWRRLEADIAKRRSAARAALQEIKEKAIAKQSRDK